MKPTNSQQVKSETVEGISEQEESDATSCFLERSISFETIPMVTWGTGHVAEQDAFDDEDQGQAMGDVQDFIAVGRTRRNLRKPSWLTTDIIVAYGFPVIKEAIPSTY